MKTFFNFSLPLDDASLMTTVRLTVGGLAAAAGLDVDAGEDFKVCVTESLLIFKRNGYALANARFTLDNGIAASLTAEHPSVSREDCALEDEISYALLGALVDEASFEKNGNAVTGVTLIKKSV